MWNCRQAKYSKAAWGEELKPACVLSCVGGGLADTTKQCVPALTAFSLDTPMGGGMLGRGFASHAGPLKLLLGLQSAVL